MRKLAALLLGLLASASLLLTGCGASPDKSRQAPPAAKTLAASANKNEASAQSKAIRRIKLTFEGGEAFAELYDNPTSRDLAALLPLTLQYKDFNQTEKIADLPRPLSKVGAPSGFDPSAGDLALYAPWGNLAVFYRDFRYSDGLISIGRFTAGLEAFATMRGTFAVRIEADEA